MFDEKQIDFMRKTGISIDFDNPSEDELLMVEDVISERLQIDGFDENYVPTEIGKMCESILDIL